MLKIFIHIFLILTLTACNQDKKQVSQTESIATSKFKNLQIDYWTGDEYRYKKQMKFDKTENEIVGHLLMPKYYVGNEVLEPKAKIITQHDLQLLSVFLDKANLYKDSCKEVRQSTSSEDYKIIVDSDTIIIERYCDWGNYTFDQLEKEIFSDFFDTLKSQRLELENRLSNQLSGYWIPIQPKKNMSRGDILQLTKSEKDENNLECFWRFDNKELFKDGCSELLDLTRSKTYRWDIDEGRISFSISSGSKKILYNGDSVLTTANYGATFNLISLTKDELKLEYLWD